MTFQKGALGGVSKFMQIVHLEGTTWDEIREVLVIILFPHQTFYQLQVNQGPQCPTFTIVRDHNYPIFVFVNDHRTNYFLSEINLSTKDIVRD